MRTDEGALAEAFSAFIAASARLELSYRDLQAEVAQLTLALYERNQALDESRSENRTMGLTLQSILDAIPCGVLITGAEGEIRLVNPEAARLLALSGSQLPTVDGIREQAGLDLRAMELLPCGTEQELSFEDITGMHWLSLRRMPLAVDQRLLPAGNPGEAVITVQDISVRKRAERERESSRDGLALAKVSALLAHEVRNPLACLELFAGLIADSPERRDEWLSHLRAGIRTLSATVNNVLALHSGSPMSGGDMELAEEARLATNFVQPLAQQAGVSLALEWELQEPACWIRASKAAFHQLVLNLCTNALRHTAPGGQVCIRCHSDENQSRACVSVRDSGSGIASDQLPHVFESGFSGSGRTPGLGLAVCQRLMRQQGGTIHVQSCPGAGSTFTLEFVLA